MLVIEVTVIQFTKMGACWHNFHEHLMQLLFLAPYCVPKTISTKYLKIREAWEKVKPIILIIAQYSWLTSQTEGKSDLCDGNRMNCVGW